jgi:hypothetical protein
MGGIGFQAYKRTEVITADPGHSENQTFPLHLGDPPLSRTQKAVPMIPKGLSR